MRLRLSKKTRKKLPIGDDQVPLKTKENLEEYLQSAISFLQTQQSVLERTLSVLEQIANLAPTMKEDVIRDISKEQETASREKFLELREELKTLSSLSFNEQSLFSQNGADQSFKLFKDAGATLTKDHIFVLRKSKPTGPLQRAQNLKWPQNPSFDDPITSVECNGGGIFNFKTKNGLHTGIDTCGSSTTVSQIKPDLVRKIVLWFRKQDQVLCAIEMFGKAGKSLVKVGTFNAKWDK